SDKYWITDPQGIAWETYHTLGEAQIYGADEKKVAAETAACCAPKPEPVTIVPRKGAGSTCR
ncbi:MAG: ArsI/CadI family heavy metal resistance metalloenzyme, partial [Burkholderiales bacterium]